MAPSARPESPEQPNAPAESTAQKQNSNPYPRTLSKKDIEDLHNKRDAFVTAMRTLSLAADTAARSGYDYLNAFISHNGNLEHMGSGMPSLAFEPLSYNAHLLARGMSVVPEIFPGLASKGDHELHEDGKRKRKRKPVKDPDAPKKPLTPYFAFLQEARPLILQELGGKATLQQFNDLGGQRWRDLSAEEQKVWQAKYQNEMVGYQASMNAYRALRGLPPLKETKAQKRNLAAYLEHAEAQGAQTEEEDDDAEAHEDEDEHSPEEEEEDAEEEEDVEVEASPPPPPPTKKAKIASAAKTNGAVKSALPSVSRIHGASNAVTLRESTKATNEKKQEE